MSKGDAPERNYQVGYKKPPRHSQFKPGQSGNPRGRKKKALADLNLADLLEKELTETIKVRMGDKVVRITPLHASVRAATQKVCKGDLKTTLQMIDYWAKHASTVEKDRVHNHVVLTFVDPDGNVNEELTKRFNAGDKDKD